MTTGVIVITHGQMAEELVTATEFILKEKTDFVPICVLKSEETDLYQAKIQEAVQSLQASNKGVLILSDVFGGTPSNLCHPFLKYGVVELVSGVNLPMLIKLATLAAQLPISELCEKIVDYGKNNIRCTHGHSS